MAPYLFKQILKSIDKRYSKRTNWSDEKNKQKKIRKNVSKKSLKITK